jgi:hypothetical protein
MSKSALSGWCGTLLCSLVLGPACGPSGWREAVEQADALEDIEAGAPSATGGTGGGASGGNGGSATGGGGAQGGSGGSAPLDMKPPADMAELPKDGPPPPADRPDAVVDVSPEAPAVARKVLLVQGTPDKPGVKEVDPVVAKRLEAKGLTVELMVHTKATLMDTQGKALVWISSSVDNALAGKLRDAPVPTIVMQESGVLGPMNMATSSGFTDSDTKLEIFLPTDPLAAGLMGQVTVFEKGERLTWGTAPASARKIAHEVGNASHAVIWSYEAGDIMVGNYKAPGKRLGFFLHASTTTVLTADGLKLVDAAIDWALK